MNREIKFRGKRVDNGEWVYGYYYKTVQRNGFSQGKEILWTTDCIRPVEPMGIFEAFYVTPETVGIFANANDFEGTEIFTGDILSRKYKAEVYQNEEGAFMVKFHINPNHNKPAVLKKYLKSREKAGIAQRDCIVVGNIYENPELIDK